MLAEAFPIESDLKKINSDIIHDIKQLRDENSRTSIENQVIHFGY